VTVGYFRLFRRIKIAPGVTINFSKSGLSTSFGPKGAKVTVGKRGVRRTVGIPGTGVYYTSTSGHSGKSSTPDAASAAAPPDARTGPSRRSWIGALIAVMILAAIAGSCLGSNSGAPGPSAAPAALGLIGQASGPIPSVEPVASATPVVTTSATSVPTTKPAATPKATVQPKAKATPAPVSTTFAVRITARTAIVTRNSTASVSIKTLAKASCSIEVDYKSGPSTAAGLGDKTASSTGVVTWSWKVGSNTTRGTWPIYISCELGSRSGSVATSFTVR
jgi:hypothetical protein